MERVPHCNHYGWVTWEWKEKENTEAGNGLKYLGDIDDFLSTLTFPAGKETIEGFDCLVFTAEQRQRLRVDKHGSKLPYVNPSDVNSIWSATWQMSGEQKTEFYNEVKKKLDETEDGRHVLDGPLVNLLDVACNGVTGVYGVTSNKTQLASEIVKEVTFKDLDLFESTFIAVIEEKYADSDLISTKRQEREKDLAVKAMDKRDHDLEQLRLEREQLLQSWKKQSRL